MFFIFIAIALVGAIVDNQIVRLAPIVFASGYILFIGPGAFTGGRELSRDKLIEQLSPDWMYADEIASFVIRYWFSIKYVMSAQKRGSLCSFMAVAMCVLGAWYWYLDLPVWIWSPCFACGAILAPIGNRVNKAMFILHYEQGAANWNLACASFVALADIFENENFKYLVDEVLPGEAVLGAINGFAKPETRERFSEKYSQEGVFFGVGTLGVPVVDGVRNYSLEKKL